MEKMRGTKRMREDRGKVKMVLMIYISGKFEHQYYDVLPYMFFLHNGLLPL